MDKLNFKTAEQSEKNIEKLAALFPSIITETSGNDGTLKKGVNFERLKQLLSPASDNSDDEERYELTWVGKKAAIAEAARSTTGTLRPIQADSLGWDTTKNLYLEGDNLEVLKLLQESYLGMIKVIYIDPPYNTGHDFIYRDSFRHSQQTENEKMGMYDEAGNRLFENTHHNGRFHSDWCSMIYPRLKLAQSLLNESGSIFISIDDNELHNLRAICDEIFGASNFVATVVWQKKYAATNDSKGFSTTHDYVVVYAKDIDRFTRNLLPRTEAQNAPYKHDDGDGRGRWRSDNLLVKSFSPSGVYPIRNPNTGAEYYPPEGSCWRASRATMDTWLAENRIYFGKDGCGAPQLKRYLSEVQQGRVPITWWGFEEVGHNDAANKELKELFQSKAPFDTPKPVALIRQILRIASEPDSIVLDFFSGSATTAQAVMQLNAEDGGHRTFILVQLPEPCAPTSDAFKAGYPSICAIGKARIRRAGNKIKKEHPNTDLDIGFRVFRVDSSNMKDVYYQPEEYTQTSILDLVSNIKEDRSDLDLLYACLLDWGLPLHLPHTSTVLDGCTVHKVDRGALVACFNDRVPASVVEYMVQQHPRRAVFRDSAFASDDAKINVAEMFKNRSPDTVLKVL